MTLAARAFAALTALLATAALVWLSGFRYVAEPDDVAAIRLSWRAAGEHVEECRTPTPEELAAVPAHMRRERICEGRLLPFRLRVQVDGTSLFDALVRASGARRDRPTYVLDEFRVAPGAHRVAVRFEVEAPPGMHPQQAPRVLDQTLVLAPRAVALVSLAPDGSSLLLTASTD
jgi:hypothetical protein